MTGDVPRVLRPAFDMMWQAVGMPRSLNYEAATGSWRYKDWT